jgi:hypothetical protein
MGVCVCVCVCVCVGGGSQHRSRIEASIHKYIQVIGAVALNTLNPANGPL